MRNIPVLSNQTGQIWWELEFLVRRERHKRLLIITRAVIRFTPINQDEAGWGPKTAGHKGGCGAIKVCGSNSRLRAVHCKNLHHLVSINIIGGQVFTSNMIA